jgi:hypothetical protein
MMVEAVDTVFALESVEAVEMLRQHNFAEATEHNSLAPLATIWRQTKSKN